MIKITAMNNNIDGIFASVFSSIYCFERNIIKTEKSERSSQYFQFSSENSFKTEIAKRHKPANNELIYLNNIIDLFSTSKILLFLSLATKILLPQHPLQPYFQQS